MKFLVQRVSEASVTVENEIVGKIGRGFLVLIGIEDEDTEAIADRMVKKLIDLRIFDDADGKTNLNIESVDGELLLISQFTLYADCRKGNRPSFVKAGKPDKANALYEYIIKKAGERVRVVEKGVFGGDMKVRLLNDGPFTVMLDSKELFS